MAYTYNGKNLSGRQMDELYKEILSSGAFTQDELQQAFKDNTINNLFSQYSDYKKNGATGSYKEWANKKASDAAARATGDIASTAANTAVRQTTNSLRQAGQSKGQAALSGANQAGVTYQNTYQNTAQNSSANLMDQLHKQLEGSMNVAEMRQAVGNEQAAQQSQLMSNIMGTVADTAQGFASGGWPGAAAAFLSDERSKEGLDYDSYDSQLMEAVEKFICLKKKLEEKKNGLTEHN